MIKYIHHIAYIFTKLNHFLWDKSLKTLPGSYKRNIFWYHVEGDSSISVVSSKSLAIFVQTEQKSRTRSFSHLDLSDEVQRKYYWLQNCDLHVLLSLKFSCCFVFQWDTGLETNYKLGYLIVSLDLLIIPLIFAMQK